MPSAISPLAEPAYKAVQEREVSFQDNGTSFESTAIPRSPTNYNTFDLPHREGSQFPGDPNLVPDSEVIGGMGNDMRQLVKKIQNLRHLGIEDNKIALPKICVVGDQSTGKSSLIEGMSEIKVPRSAGTCTRCPMEINLSESNEPWQCTISLSRSYIFNPRQALTKISKSKPLGPWSHQDAQDEHFVTLKSKDQVQEAIKLAQLAILNPQNDPSSYVPGSSSTVDQTFSRVKFSPNVVRLDISAPGFPNLAFYDLPGVISQAEVDEEAYLVTLVENLVKHYVQQKNCIILLTLPMTDDATNSSAARIIREIKATQRALGVLTKPDRMEDSSQWADILGGKKFLLGHGYYVIRNNPDPSVDHLQARTEEELFFATPPWKTDLAIFQRRFGTRKLQNALSELLLDQIKKSLPDVICQINEKAQRISKELELLPEPVNHNPYNLSSKLQELNHLIGACVDGGSKDFPMLKLFNHIASDFYLALQLTRPSIRMVSDEDVFEKRMDNEGDSDCEILSSHQTPKRKLENKPATVNQTIAEPKKQYATTHFHQFTEPAYCFQLTEIRDINAAYFIGGIHNQIYPGAIVDLNKKFVAHWDKPMEKFLEVTNKLVRDKIFEQVNKVLAPYQDTELHRQVSRITGHRLSQLRKDLELRAFELCNLEKSKPFTMAETYMQQKEKHYNELFVQKRKFQRTKRYHQSQESPDETPKSKSKMPPVDLGPDPFENEIVMVAKARAYYDVAATRFVDSLCQKVYMNLFFKCKDLYSIIEKELGITKEDPMVLCARLMAHDPERQLRREELLREQEKLSKAQQWLADTAKQESDDEMELDDESAFTMPLCGQEEDDKSKVFE